jgi:hypothetical protein
MVILVFLFSAAVHTSDVHVSVCVAVWLCKPNELNVSGVSFFFFPVLPEDFVLLI